VSLVRAYADSNPSEIRGRRNAPVQEYRKPWVLRAQ